MFDLTASQMDSLRHALVVERSGAGTARSTTTRAAARAAGSEQWQMLEPPDLGTDGSNMIVDPERDRLVVFGWPVGFADANQVWVRPLADDAARWTRLDVAGPKPPIMSWGTAIHDAQRQRMIVYSGNPAAGVWALSLSGTPTWTRLADGGVGPGGLLGIVGVYDPVGDRLVVFGSAPEQNDVWTFALGDGSGWSMLSPAGARPSFRTNYAAVYDSDRRRMVMFSGQGVLDPDVWALSLDGAPAWTELHPGGDAPPALYQVAAAYDAAHDRMALYSGVVSGGDAGDVTWVLQFGDAPTWSRITTSVKPLGRNGSCMVHDAARDRFVMFGGGIGDTWSLSLDPSPSWRMIEDNGSAVPYGTYFTQAVYDPTRQRTLLFGGAAKYFYSGDAYDVETNTLWSLSTDRFARWSFMAREPAAQPTAGMSLFIDSEADRLISIAGRSNSNFGFGDPMQLSLSGTAGWQRLYAAGELPPGRQNQMGIFDPVRRRFIMFGGRGAGVALRDMWILELNGHPRWEQLDPNALAPSARFGANAVYDPLGDRVILFGGTDADSTAFGDTWQLSLAGTPTWSRLSPSGAPSPRCFAATTYDSRRQRLVMFGGRDDEGEGLDDLWFLPLGTASKWVHGEPADSVPAERWGAGAAYDSDQDRVIVINGTYDPCAYGYDQSVLNAWALYSSDPVLPELAAPHIVAHPHDVRLEWRVPATPDFAGSIERKSGSEPWRVLGRAVTDPSGTARFIDTDAEPGIQYSYRMRWDSGASSNTTASAPVDVPALRFALARATNPAVDGLAVAFSLPDAAGAKLEVLDIAGRHVVSRAVGALGAGDHVLQLAQPGSIAPGLYIVRLTRGAESRTTRVSIIR